MNSFNGGHYSLLQFLFSSQTDAFGRSGCALHQQCQTPRRYYPESLEMGPVYMWTISPPKLIARATSWPSYVVLACRPLTCFSSTPLPCGRQWSTLPLSGTLASQPSSATSWRPSNAPHSGSFFPTCHTAGPCSILVCRPSVTGVSTCAELSQLRRWRTQTWPTGFQAGSVTVTPTTCATTTIAGSPA